MIRGKYNVQIDETVIHVGTCINLLSKLYDDIPGLTFLVELIEEHTGRMCIEIVSDRKSETLLKLIRKHVFIGFLIITNGHSSYPKAIKEASCTHEIVNYSLGFKNKNGFNTNNIDNLWFLIRYEEIIR